MAPRSVTTTEPIRLRFMRAVASAKELSAEHVTGGADISSWTAVGTLFVLSSGRGPSASETDGGRPLHCSSWPALCKD